MTRCNYFIALHMGIWSVVVTIALFAVQRWLTDHNSAVLWLGGLGIQGLLQLWTTLLEEQYLAVSYIENELRRCVVHALPTTDRTAFWRYEAFLSQRRMHENWWGEWIAPALIAFGIGAGIYLRSNAVVEDLPYIIANASLLLILTVRTHLRVKMRRSFSSAFIKLHKSSGAA